MTEENIQNSAHDANLISTEEEDFATLFEKSGAGSKRLEPGQKVNAKIVSISGDYVFIDLGGKSEGVINLNEFLKEDGTYHVNEGDAIDAFFVAFSDGLKRFTSRSKGYSTVDLQGIRNAYERISEVTKAFNKAFQYTEESYVTSTILDIFKTYGYDPESPAK